MLKLQIKDYRRRETRIGKETRYELVIDCELEPNERKVEIVSVVTGWDELEDVYQDLKYVIEAGNTAIENPT